MKAAYRILAVVPLVVLWAAAQDGPARLETVIQTRLGDLKQAKVMGIGGAVMGPAVKNAPYTAVEVTESTQVLGDGNRIHRRVWCVFDGWAHHGAADSHYLCLL